MKNKIILTFLFISIINSMAQQRQFLNFDGTDDYVVSSSSVNWTNTSLTIEFWAKKNHSNYSDDTYIFSVGNAGTNNLLAVLFRDNKRLSLAFWGNDINSTTEITDTNWHHYACVFDTSGITSYEQRLYIDGVLDTTRTNILTSTNANGVHYIGRTSLSTTTGNFFSGSIDEMRIWNVARTTTEISANVHNELSLPQTGLVSYYKFNQGVANGNNSTVTTLVDETNSNDGTLRNFALTGTQSNWSSDSSLSTNNFTIDVFSVYPNPVQNTLTIQLEDTLKKAEIYTLLGKKVLESTSKEINTSNLAQGMYVLKVATTDGKVATQKIIKE